MTIVLQSKIILIKIYKTKLKSDCMFDGEYRLRIQLPYLLIN